MFDNNIRIPFIGPEWLLEKATANQRPHDEGTSYEPKWPLEPTCRLLKVTSKSKGRPRKVEHGEFPIQ